MTEVFFMQRSRLIRVAVYGLLALLFVLVTGVGDAHAWWDGKWKYRRKIILDTSPQGSDIKEALTDFPVLVGFHSGNFTFENAKSDGTDIRFVSGDDKTPLKYHIERFDQKLGLASIWVKMPKITAVSNQDFIWVYFGNESAAGGDEAGGTYDTPQLGVYHFNEKDGAPRDATAYGNHAKEFTGKLGTTGPIGQAISFKGEGEKMIIAKSPSLNISKGFTYSAWIKLARSQEDARLLSWDDGKQSIVIGIEGAKLYSAFTDQKTKTVTGKTADMPVQKWVYVTITAEPGKNLVIYTGGQEKATQKLPGGLPEPAADIAIGATLQGKNAFVGDMDEIKLAGTARSSIWVRAEAVSEGPETPLLAFGEEEATSGGGENLTIHLLVVTAKSITLDGWLVIGMCLIMTGITWILFFNKFMVLRKVKKDNNAFISAFAASNDVDSLAEKEDDLPESSLFRVYKAGGQELERRFGKKGEERKACVPQQAISAFKAALIRSSLQESKRNAAGLILFTLSISGGPFMGLFGTVWGVINTFAGVAEAGEANLAAIAPGVASALACTLMGLVLAIPALFQYSYLTAEIKNITADMNVFMNEYTTRVEEEYGDTQ
jgi:biopolymer transport protein ExbB